MNNSRQDEDKAAGGGPRTEMTEEEWHALAMCVAIVRQVAATGRYETHDPQQWDSIWKPAQKWLHRNKPKGN